jgi:broad specificity polyphosphatase/5'/3'-nucleotidase SurE
MAAVNRGLASVTPLHLDLTHYGALERMADWESGLNSLLKQRPR